MNKIKICAVVTGRTIEEFISNLIRIQKTYEFVELRVDYINDFNIDMISQIRLVLKVKSIFTCRLKKYGGSFPDTKKSKLNEIIQKANNLRFDYIDIDLGIIKSIEIKNKKSKLIASYHNFDKTPNLEELDKITIKMKNSEADIYKYATMVNNVEDLNRIYRLLIEKENNENVIALGMGEKGRISRIISPLLGGYLTYASSNGGKSAPGQIDLSKLNSVYNVILSLSKDDIN